jgi:hypothetical protein
MSASNNNLPLVKNNSYPSSIVDSNEKSLLKPFLNNKISSAALLTLAKKLKVRCKALSSIIASENYKNAEAILLLAIKKVTNTSVLFWYLREWYAIILALLDEQLYLHKGFIIRNYHRDESQEYFQAREKAKHLTDNYENAKGFECSAISLEGVLFI